MLLKFSSLFKPRTSNWNESNFQKQFIILDEVLIRLLGKLQLSWKTDALYKEWTRALWIIIKSSGLITISEKMVLFSELSTKNVFYHPPQPHEISIPLPDFSFQCHFPESFKNDFESGKLKSIQSISH
jgi:hypothetical protein